MATYRDPATLFAPLEVIDRILEIRAEFGYAGTIYLERVNELTNTLDAYGFDIYAFSTNNEKLKYGDYRTPVVPGGYQINGSLMAH